MARTSYCTALPWDKCRPLGQVASSLIHGFFGDRETCISLRPTATLTAWSSNFNPHEKGKQLCLRTSREKGRSTVRRVQRGYHYCLISQHFRTLLEGRFAAGLSRRRQTVLTNSTSMNGESYCLNTHSRPRCRTGVTVACSRSHEKARSASEVTRTGNTNWQAGLNPMVMCQTESLNNPSNLVREGCSADMLHRKI